MVNTNKSRKKYGFAVGMLFVAFISLVFYEPAKIYMSKGESLTQEQQNLQVIAEKKTVLNAVLTAQKVVESCYLEMVKANPDIRSIAIVQFWIEWSDKIGIITDGGVPKNESISPVFDICIKNTLSEVEFKAEPGAGHQRMLFPFAFNH